MLHRRTAPRSTTHSAEPRAVRRTLAATGVSAVAHLTQAPTDHLALVSPASTTSLALATGFVVQAVLCVVYIGMTAGGR